MFKSLTMNRSLRVGILSRSISSDSPAFQDGAQYSVRNLVALMLAGFMVESEVLSSVDPAQSRFHGGIGQTVKVASYPRQGFGGYIKADLISQINYAGPSSLLY
jgi:hypothetical protein